MAPKMSGAASSYWPWKRADHGPEAEEEVPGGEQRGQDGGAAAEPPPDRPRRHRVTASAVIKENAEGRARPSARR